ncbi:F0F1 ATP synthase subunit B [Aeromicrobium terrae]|uniref:F0F1 ATP synthase subunit B n=1 Tax=Aeromicrobium terrae TaxID=2498846 RepID=UPI001C9D2783|nr:F0F1 ATP synthase subunit B [Aeromicrobium terrae]
MIPSIILAAAEEGGSEEKNNFLVPNATFLFELVSFAIILFVLWKWILPPINNAMTERQNKIKAQFEEAEKLKAEAQAAEAENQSQLAEARAEASRIREEAREQGAQIVAQHREQAVVEAERITSAAQAQIEVERAQALAQLKNEVGTIATTLAGRIVGESFDDDERSKRSVDEFIAGLESAPKSEA